MRGNKQSLISQIAGVLLALILVFSVVKVLGIQNIWDINEWRTSLSGAGKSLEQTLDNPPKFTPGSSNDSGSETSSSSTDSGAASEQPPADASSETNTEALLASLTVGEAQTVDYNRDEWRHWDGYGSSCWSIRDEVLYRQSVEGKVVLEDSDHQTTTDKTEACYLASGEWLDPYTGKTFTNPSDLDVDHMIPLGYAAEHGGQAWSAEVKAEYANSLNENHLIAVMASANRQKGARGPGDWKPQQSFQCEYAKIWVNISSTWELTTSQSDYNALEDMLNNC